MTIPTVVYHLVTAELPAHPLSVAVVKYGPVAAVVAERHEVGGHEILARK